MPLVYATSRRKGSRFKGKHAWIETYNWPTSISVDLIGHIAMDYVDIQQTEKIIKLSGSQTMGHLTRVYRHNTLRHQTLYVIPHLESWGKCKFHDG